MNKPVRQTQTSICSIFIPTKPLYKADHAGFSPTCYRNIHEPVNT